MPDSSAFANAFSRAFDDTAASSAAACARASAVKTSATGSSSCPNRSTGPFSRNASTALEITFCSSIPSTALNREPPLLDNVSHSPLPVKLENDATSSSGLPDSRMDVRILHRSIQFLASCCWRPIYTSRLASSTASSLRPRSPSWDATWLIDDHRLFATLVVSRTIRREKRAVDFSASLVTEDSAFSTTGSRSGLVTELNTTFSCFPTSSNSSDAF
mmetsp:Transcript_4708/g.13524  ORF Transcript_4708/g.13524 Transcript_4708/m.13524 type:complete len:217 (-) Transcript_4708:541-1191(-)